MLMRLLLLHMANEVASKGFTTKNKRNPDGFDLTFKKEQPHLEFLLTVHEEEAVRGFSVYFDITSLVAKFPVIYFIAGLIILITWANSNGFNSWKHWAVQFVKDSGIESKIDWVGYLPKICMSPGFKIAGVMYTYLSLISQVGV